MRIADFENFVISEIYDEELYEEYLERNILKIDDEITEDRILSEMKIDYLETSTLEYLEEISKVDFLSDEELREKALKGDVDSKDEVITKSLRLPILLGIILLKNGINYLDLTQEGTIALIEAIGKFPNSGYKSFEDYIKINVVRKMVIYTNERLQESKAEFIKHFEVLKEEYEDRSDVVEGINDKIKTIENINYNSLFNCLDKNEIKIIERFYGLKDGKRESMLQIEEKLGLGKGKGQDIFQKAINKISNFGGELFTI